ncbi:MAG: hypothetical protein WA213_20725 [Terriglobales bacterium]
MSIGDILSDIGKGAATGARAVGAVLPPVLQRTAQVLSGEAPQIDEEKRQQATQMDDAALNAKADELEAQLAMGRKYGTLTPQQQQQYVDQITGLFSHPKHMNTLMTRLQKAIHPGGATYQQGEPLPSATPAGGTAAADTANAEKLAEAKVASKPLPKDAAFLESYAHSLGKTWAELTPDEMVEAFNKEGETRAAQEKEAHQKALEDYRTATLTLRKSEEALHEAQFKASQDPNNPKLKLEAEKARTQAMRDEAYWVRAQAAAFGEVNGEPLPGAVLTPSGTPMGSTFAGQYVKSQQAMAQLNDAGGAVNTVGNALGKLYSGGGSLNDPRLAEALAHHDWTAAQVAQGIVGKTLTPEERDVVTAIVSARENIQGMRKAAGGGLSNEQVNRLEAQLPGPNTPNAAYAKQQLTLLNQTLQRLSEGVPATVGGYTFRWEPQGATGAQPVGKILPKVATKPGAAVPPAAKPAPSRPQGVPANAVWNAQGNGGKGAWQLPQ